MAGQMMAVREKMGLTVRELLLAEEMKDIEGTCRRQRDWTRKLRV
ncbi:MAG: hypothetical protein ACLTBV_24940 [Enterocloster bolteae]